MLTLQIAHSGNNPGFCYELNSLYLCKVHAGKASRSQEQCSQSSCWSHPDSTEKAPLVDGSGMAGDFSYSSVLGIVSYERTLEMTGDFLFTT